ncbi:Fic family protein [Fusobacterium necrophorum]|uniref:Fic family protein n=1 Tax=Fusobacterium necrophorum TaxID=859 RepID=UPI001B8BB3DF|nr:Fic family protein [Fusobacterium necrophorum]MBR8823903.1 hypothetical protein [Fusobacterium necrophorum]
MKQKNILDILLEEKKMNLRGRLYHYTQVHFTYNSNHIEGSRLTEEQTRHIFETNTFLPDGSNFISVDDITETINHFRCFDYILLHAKEPLSEDLIKKIHKILKTNTSDSQKEWFQVGEYKTLPNMVGDTATSLPEQVSSDIQFLLQEYQKKQNITLEDIIDFHARFEMIHPFQDGNGRVGRLLMFKGCLAHNMIPFILDEEHKLFYYRGLREYKKEKGWLRDTCLSAQDKYKLILDQLKIIY